MFYLDDMESVNFEIERDPKCPYCREYTFFIIIIFYITSNLKWNLINFL